MFQSKNSTKLENFGDAVRYGFIPAENLIDVPDADEVIVGFVAKLTTKKGIILPAERQTVFFERGKDGKWYQS